MRVKKYRILGTFLLISIFSSLLFTAYADVGPKPSITVNVKNFKSQSYYLDLLEQSEDSFYDSLNEKYSETYKQLELYKYREGNWMAKHIRYKLLFGNLNGEYDKRSGMMVHRFSYHGVPQTFKVIVQDENGNIMVSKEVTPNRFNACLLFDMQTGKLEVVRSLYLDFAGNTGSLLITVLICMLLTVSVELVVAIPFRIRPYGLVVFVNIFSQAILHAVLIGLYLLKQYQAMHLAFIISEAAVFLIEYLIYRAKLPEVKTKLLASYVLTANLSTLLIGLTIQI